MKSDDPHAAAEANPRFKLWYHMSKEHNLTLLESEMDEIIGLAIAENNWRWKQLYPDFVPIMPTIAKLVAENASDLANLKEAIGYKDAELTGLRRENAALQAQVERLEKDISLREDADNIADTEAYKTAQLITDLRAQLATATAELAEERTRLDWLETQGTKPRWTHNPESNFNSWSVVGKPKHETVRRAIDAHIDAARAQEDRK